MAYIEEAIFQHLTGKTDVTDLVARRIYPERAPQRRGDIKRSLLKYPYVTYRRVSGERVHDFGVETGTALPRFQFDVWAKTFSDALDVADAIRKNLNGLRGIVTVSGENVFFHGAYHRGDFDVGVAEGEGGESATFRRTIDYEIWHDETAATPSV